MVRSPSLFLAACLIAILFIGCSTMESLHSSRAKPTHDAKSKSKTQETDDGDADEESGSSWKNGDDSRDALAREEALDPWFGKFDYADKGRAIERSLR